MTSPNDRIISAVDRLFDDQIRFLEALVRCRSLRNQEAAAQDFIEVALRERGFTISRFRADASKIGQHPTFSPATADYEESMLGFKSVRSASATLDGIELVHMMRKHQGEFVFSPRPSLAEQFNIIAT